MAKIGKGDYFPNFVVDTVFEKDRKISQLIGPDKTAIIFLRYEGCTLCRYDMMLIKKNYTKIMESGSKVIVILQSNPDRVRNELDKDFYPFDIICDPNQELYQNIEIRAAASEKELIGPGTMDKLKEVEESGLSHGEYEGEEMQLPATFIVDQALKVQYARYAEHLTDIPDVYELVEILKSV